MIGFVVVSSVAPVSPCPNLSRPGTWPGPETLCGEPQQERPAGHPQGCKHRAARRGQGKPERQAGKKQTEREIGPGEGAETPGDPATGRFGQEHGLHWARRAGQGDPDAKARHHRGEHAPCRQGPAQHRTTHLQTPPLQDRRQEPPQDRCADGRRNRAVIMVQESQSLGPVKVSEVSDKIL